MPNISSSLVLVNRDGEVVVDSGRVMKGQGKRFEGDSVGMLRRDYVHFTEKSINAYCQALAKSADNMKQRLSKALSKKK
jgi:hypothetical protein